MRRYLFWLRVRRLFFYLVYVGFVVALTTSVVVADMASRSFLVKRRCYELQGGELVPVVPQCQCQCRPADRLWDSMWCKNCKHYVSADAYVVAKPTDQKKVPHPGSAK